MPRKNEHVRAVCHWIKGVPLGNQEARVAVKFCGLCTEYIDVRQVVKCLRGLAAEVGFVLVPLSGAEGDIDAVVILCGCSLACADRNDVRSKAAQVVVIAGEVVDGKRFSFETVPLAAVDALRQALQRSALTITGHV